MTDLATTDDPQTTTAPRGAAALSGLAAAAVALAVGEALAVVTGRGSAPVVAVSDAFVDATPLWLKNLAVDLFGTADKAVLLGGATLVVLALAALAGVLEARRPPVGSWLVLALGAVAAFAAATRPDAGPLAVLPSVLGGLAGVAVLRRLLRPAPAAPGRRAVLGLPLAVLGGGAALWAGARWVGTRLRTADASRAEVVLPAPTSPAPALPAGVEVDVPGVTPFRVPAEEFYRIDTALVVPQVSAQEWSLRIHGLVEREVTLDFETLLARGLVERDVTLCCVSNAVGGDLVGNAVWRGLPVAPLLEQAGVKAGADMVLSTSADGWTCSTPIEALTDGRDSLLAVGMNGAPLPVEHGFPVRLVVPGLYGYVSATKWVVDLEVTRFDAVTAYWTDRGWSERGPVKTASRIDVPRSGRRVKAGTVAVAGVAWAQHRGIRRVEVRVDEGPWQEAELAAEASVDTWRQWVYRWDANPGSHELQVRATDGTGEPQTGEQRDVVPDGATGWHTVSVTVE